MATTDGSENLLDLSERIKPNGWLVVSNPIRQPVFEADGWKIRVKKISKN